VCDRRDLNFVCTHCEMNHEVEPRNDREPQIDLGSCKFTSAESKRVGLDFDQELIDHLPEFSTESDSL
jgi:hypothetical protein